MARELRSIEPEAPCAILYQLARSTQPGMRQPLRLTGRFHRLDDASWLLVCVLSVGESAAMFRTHLYLSLWVLM